MRLVIISLLFLVMVGCQTTSAGAELPEIILMEETGQESPKENLIEAELSTEITTESPAVPAKNSRPAWTDYSNYARPNEEGYAYYIPNDPDISSEVLPIEENSSGDVLLFTFDDAPQSPDSYAIHIAQTLKNKDVNAIFLVNGMYLETNQGKEITKQLYEMGFEIGNHTQTHPHLRELSYEEQYEEVLQTSLLVEEITGEKPRWFRPPFGLYNMDTILICNELEMQLINWSFGYDWMDEYLEADALAEISLTTPYLRGGANILMHDRYWTAAALERMIDGYKEQGYEIVDPLLIQAQENSLQPMAADE